MKLIDFEVNGRGFLIEYHKQGTKKEVEDKYWVFFVDNKTKKRLICLREDECVLLSALLNFGVHKKMVDIDKVGIDIKDKQDEVKNE